ncbi:MAG: phage tail protein [Burkholderiales bacterium]|nr:phage tail protein [Burkholderiales bacterium]
MYKAQSLRHHLCATVPDFKRSPDKLAILVKNGKVIAAGEASLSYEYAATVQIMVLDYAGSPDAVMLPILVWLRTHQPEYFDNPALRAQAFRFDVDINDGKTIDIAIELDLTERVSVTAKNPADNPAPGAYNVHHLGEPPRTRGLGDTDEHWEFWLRGELLAEWDYTPAEFDHAPRLIA